MKALLIALLLPWGACAQDTASFARALQSGKPARVDRWMKHELHRQRKGHLVTTPSTSYVTHHQTFDSLAAFLRRQPGVQDAAWDGCMSKIMLWPGHSRIGLRYVAKGVVHERCYRVQEGEPGVIRLPGWRPHVRRDREVLKWLGGDECPGFVEEMNGHCAKRKRR